MSTETARSRRSAIGLPVVLASAAKRAHVAPRRQGGRKILDLLTAAAEQAGLIVLHYLSDDDVFAKVTGQFCEWIVPVGSVD